MDHFYKVHLENGYKVCDCATCATRLSFPILIKNRRNANEYEFIHKAYLQSLLHGQRDLV